MKVNRSNQKQITWIFNKANLILTKYLEQDLSKESTWKCIIDDCNDTVSSAFDDCLTEEIMFAIVRYLEEVYRAGRPDNPVLAEQKGFVQDHTGFKQEKPRGFTVGR